jgi:pimeloyl-ACP methyl ester carboxylesterase
MDAEQDVESNRATRMKTAILLGTAFYVWVATSATAAHASPCDHPGNVQFVTGGNECLLIRTARGSAATTGGPLFILLHGDFSHEAVLSENYFNKAKQLTELAPSATAIAMARPGYQAPSGLGSTGESYGHHDNETAENIDDIAGAIQTLRGIYHPSKVVLIGHSGGAQVAAIILARHPHLADAAVLVSGPFDVAAWKAAHNISGPFRSESPLRYVDRIPPDTRIVVIEGTSDTNTFPALAEQYTAALKARGVPVQLIEVPGADHDAAFNAPAVYSSALQLAK